MPLAEELRKRHRAWKENLGTDLSIYGDEMMANLRENPMGLPISAKKVVDVLRSLPKAKEAAGAMLGRYPTLTRFLEDIQTVNFGDYFGEYTPKRGSWKGVRPKVIINTREDLVPDSWDAAQTVLHELGHGLTERAYPTIFEKYYKRTQPARRHAIEKLADAVARVEGRFQGLDTSKGIYSQELTPKQLKQWDWHAEMLLADYLRKGLE